MPYYFYTSVYFLVHDIIKEYSTREDDNTETRLLSASELSAGLSLPSSLPSGFLICSLKPPCRREVSPLAAVGSGGRSGPFPPVLSCWASKKYFFQTHSCSEILLMRRQLPPIHTMKLRLIAEKCHLPLGESAPIFSCSVIFYFPSSSFQDTFQIIKKHPWTHRIKMSEIIQGSGDLASLPAVIQTE